MLNIPASFEIRVIIALALCLVPSYILNLLARRFKLPTIIAPLLIGLSINYIFHRFSLDMGWLGWIIEAFAGFGIVSILFFIGLKVDFRFLKNLSKNSSVMALTAAMIPFLMGFFAGYIYTKDVLTSVFIGIALSITAEEVSVAILDELKLLRSRIGQLIIDSGIIGDLFEIFAIAFLGFLIKSRAASASFTLYNIFFELALLIIIILFVRYYLIGILLKIPGKGGRKYDYLAAAFAVLLVVAVSSELLEFSYIFGALVAGLILKDKLIEDKMYYEEHSIIESLEVFNFGIFEPILFIWIGMSIDISSVFQNLGFGIVLTLIATTGKLVGCTIGNYLCNASVKEGFLIGWGLNARGATELFAALIAKNLGIFPSEIFSSIVFMALATTIVSPIIFKLLVFKGFGISKRKSE